MQTPLFLVNIVVVYTMEDELGVFFKVLKSIYSWCAIMKTKIKKSV